MKLAYRTRAGSSPQGKPRVWYTGHPAEAALFAEEIFADLFKAQNCAVYYDAEPDAPFDEAGLLHELSQMQLFVVPVTSRFLYQPNRAREIEFAYAVQHHIPVLPLLQEQGLESAFNEICGDLQLLNKNDPDPTALPYAQKLEKFLSSVLVGDELAAKVRAAFDAYVFLSYRKKDRKYAQELMRLIHKNAFCRDIAIWYDEFLTPGEDFNRAIADALQKCSLFTLAVTPNLLEPGNYVMAQEYPEAKRAGKPVLPVELAPTDRAALEGSFEGLPLCTSAYNESALSGALLDAVRRLAITQNDSDPEHNFFIGLAYLGGIDVEVDRTRALSLITGAADAGLPEAMEKLVAMYQSGDGAARDYRTAAGWQEKLAAARQAAYEESGSEEAGIALVNALWDLGDCRQALASFAAAREAFRRMEEVSGALFARTGSARAERCLAVSRSNLGLICVKMGDLAAARASYEQSYALYKRRCEEAGSSAARRGLAVICIRMGDLCVKEGDLAAARQYYEQDLALTKQRCAQSGSPGARRSLSISCDKMGSFCQQIGDLAAAREYFEQDLALTKQLYAETGSAGARRDLLICLCRLGDLCAKEGKTDAAGEYYRQSCALAAQQESETGTIEARRDLSMVCGRMGTVCHTRGELAAARRYYEQNHALARQLAGEAGTLAARRDLSVSCSRLGALCQAEGDLAAARQYFEQDYALARQLAADDETPGALRDLAASCRQLAQVCQAAGEKTDARQYYKMECMLRRHLARLNAERETEPGVRLGELHELLASLEQLAAACGECGDLPAFRAHAAEALGLARQLAAQLPDDRRYPQIIFRLQECIRVLDGTEDGGPSCAGL